MAGLKIGWWWWKLLIQGSKITYEITVYWSYKLLWWNIKEEFVYNKTTINTVEPVLEGCPIGHIIVVSQDKWVLVTGLIHCNVGISARNMWSFKTGGLSWQWSLKRAFTVSSSLFCLQSLLSTVSAESPSNDLSPTDVNNELKTEDRAFCELFNLPRSEKPLKEWTGGRRCAYIDKEKSLTSAFKPGKLYLTNRYIHFVWSVLKLGVLELELQRSIS